MVPVFRTALRSSILWQTGAYDPARVTLVMLSSLELSGQPLKLEQISQVAAGSLATGPFQHRSLQHRVFASGSEKLLRDEKVAYGVNTGFGKLADVHIPAGELDQLQVNLVP